MFTWFQNLFDRGRWDTAELVRRLGMSPGELRAVRVEYEQFPIKKRRGGTRTILAPAPPLKALQRRVLRRLLAKLRAHDAVHGFERGRSIVTNAAPHAGRHVVIRLDVRDFFPATTAARVNRYFRTIGWRRDAATLLTKLCTHAGGLPQGAPTSPRLANLVNHPLDARLAALARSFNATYTRYADDLTFSSDEPLLPSAAADPKTLTRLPHRRPLREVIPFVKRILAEHGYALHEGPKLRVMRRHDRQQVTGLIVNARPALPRKTRRWLRAVEHRAATGRPTTLTPEQLQGWRALAAMVDGRRGE